MEDCDASIVSCLCPLGRRAVVGPEDGVGVGFPAVPGEWSRLRGFTASAGKEVARGFGARVVCGEGEPGSPIRSCSRDKPQTAASTQ